MSFLVSIFWCSMTEEIVRLSFQTSKQINLLASYYADVAGMRKGAFLLSCVIRGLYSFSQELGPIAAHRNIPKSLQSPEPPGVST